MPNEFLVKMRVCGQEREQEHDDHEEKYEHADEPRDAVLPVPLPLGLGIEARHEALPRQALKDDESRPHQLLQKDALAPKEGGLDAAAVLEVRPENRGMWERGKEQMSKSGGGILVAG